MTCQICYSPYSGTHICTVLTCSNCFSPKEITSRYCFNCLCSTPCFFCTNQSVYEFQGTKVCFKHLQLSCKLELDLRICDRKEFNDNYETVMEKQRIRREKKIRRPYKKGFFAKAGRPMKRIKQIINNSFKTPSYE